MFYTYVIQSTQEPSFFYKGHCEDLNKRLEQHNLGSTKSIKNKDPFKIVYWEEFETRQEAIRREKYFKTAAGRRYLKTKLAP
jgi:putative endonuclease